MRAKSDLHAYQQAAIDWIYEHDHSLALCPVGCHEKGTRVILATGRFIAVEDVVVGDCLLGANGEPRTVLRLHRGVDTMYRVTPVKGTPFVVNGGHILSLIATPYAKGAGGVKTGLEITNISVREHLARPMNWQRNWKLRRNDAMLPFSVTFSDPPIPPYVLGALIGDGHLKGSAVNLTTPDAEIHDEVAEWASSVGTRVRIELLPNNKSWTAHYPVNEQWDGGHIKNVLTENLKYLGLHNTLAADKFIPDTYKFGSAYVRLEILAGLLDTDGHYSKTGFEFSSKSIALLNDVVFIARSVGLTCSVTRIKVVKETNYYVTYITGNTKLIPTRVVRKKANTRLQKKRANVTGFTAEKLGTGEYYGFELDGDHLYFTDDFVVHHNSGKTAIAWTAIAELMDEGHVRHPIVIAPLRVAQNVWAQERAQWEHLDGRPVVLWGGEPAGWDDSPWKTSRQLWGQRTHAEGRVGRIVDVRKRRVVEQKIKDLTAAEKKVNTALRKSAPAPGVHVTSYENLLWLCELYAPGESPFDMWVLDEIGKLKNPKSPRYKAIRKHTAEARIVVGLNATPAPEGMQDLFTQVQVVDSGKLWGKSFYAWRQKYFVPADYMGFDWRPQLGAPEPLLKDLNTLAFRVDEAQLAYQSSMQHSQIVIDLPPVARAAYDEMEKTMALAREGGNDIVALSAAAASMKLRQITQGFIYDGKGGTVILHEEKAHALADLIDDMGREPLLVAYEFAEDLEAIRRVWKNVPYLGQGISSSAANDTIARWNRRESPVLALHKASAGHGLNLQDGGSHVGWYALPWDLEGYVQLNGRVDRQGQTRACFGHHIIARDSQDQRVSDALLRKDVDQNMVLQAIRKI